VLTDCAVTRTEGAPLPGHVPSSSNGRWGRSRHLRLPSHRTRMKRSADDPERRIGKTPGNAQSPGGTSGHPGVPRRRSRAPTVLAHDAGPCPVGGRHLQPRTIHRARERPQGIPGSLEEDPGQRHTWSTAQDPIWRVGATCRSAPLIRRCIHTQGGTPLPEAHGKGYNRIDRQHVKRDSTEYNYQLHTGCRVLCSQRPEPV
jgi:hypothetical protein